MRLEHRIPISLLLVSCFLLFSCVKNPITGKREFHMVGEKAELSLGQESKKQLIQEYGLYVHPQLQSYINEVGQKLVAVCERKKLPYEFVILDTPLVNAFAVPGVVFLTRGILELIDDEAELAAVIGHEIGHITGYHAVKLLQKAMGYQFLSTFATVAAALYGPRADDPRAYAVIHEATNLVAGGFLSGYGRQFELEADRSGLRYAILAGYDPEAMVSFFKRMKSLGEEKAHGIGIFLRTHPPTEQRIKQVRRELALLAGDSETERKKGIQTQLESTQRAEKILRSTESAALTDHFERYQEIVKNLPKIPDPAGKIMGNVYENSDFKIRLKVPVNWHLEQSYGNALVKFYSPNGKAQGELQAVKIIPDPMIFALKQESVTSSPPASENAPFAGTHLSSPTLNVREWAESMEKNFKFKKRTGREVTYPAGPAYVATYQGRDKTGRPAHFKLYFLLAKSTVEETKPYLPLQHGFILSCAAPEESYLDYLLDCESVMNSISFFP